jgi:hypothetical protein
MEGLEYEEFMEKWKTLLCRKFLKVYKIYSKEKMKEEYLKFEKVVYKLEKFKRKKISELTNKLFPLRN